MARSSEHEYDRGVALIEAGKVHFGVADIPLDWIPWHPVACNRIGLLNIVLPAPELARWRRAALAGTRAFRLRSCLLPRRGREPRW